MPDNILTTISRLREARRLRQARLEGFSTVATAIDKNPFLAKPQPTVEPLSADDEERFLRQNKTDRRQVINYLDDEQLASLLGITSAYSMQTGEAVPGKPYGDLSRYRQDPDRHLQPGQLARLDRIGFELGIRDSSKENLGFWERVVRSVPVLPGTGLTSRNIGSSSKLLFGDSSMPDIMLNPRGGVSHGMLLDPQDQADYIRRKGLVGLFSDAWVGMIQEPAAATGTGMLASIHTLLGGSNQLAENISKRIDAGEQSSVAAYNAYKETDLPPYVKGTAQELFDPTNWMVVGLLGKTAQTGVRGIPTAGKALFGAGKTAAVELSESDLIRNKAIRALLHIDKVPITTKHVSKRNVEAAKDLFQELDKKVGIADDWYESMKLVPEPLGVADELPRVQRQTWARAAEAAVPTPEDAVALGRAPSLVAEAQAWAAWPVKQGAKLTDPSLVEGNPVKQLQIAYGAALSNWDRTKRVSSEIIRLLEPQMDLNAEGYIGAGIKLQRAAKAPSFASQADKDITVADLRARLAAYEQSIAVEPRAQTLAQRDIIKRSLASAEQAPVGIAKTAAKVAGVRRSLHMGSFLETKPEDLDKVYGGLTDAHRLFHATVRRSVEDLHAIKVKYDLLPQAEIAKGIEYWPRFEENISVYKELERAASRRDIGLGTKQRFQFGRQHEYVSDNLRAGHKLIAKPALVWELHVNQVARAVVERQLHEAFKSEGLLLGTKDIELQTKNVRKLRDAVTRHTSKPSERTLTTLRETDDTEIQRILALEGDEQRAAFKAYSDTLAADMNLLSDAAHAARGGTPLRAGGPLLRGETAATEEIGEAILRAIKGQQARGAFREEVIDIPRIIGSTADFMRTVSTNLDFSAPFLQGLPLLFLRPDLWAVATAKHFEAAFIPSARSRFAAENIVSIQEMTRFGVQFGTSEFTAAMKQKFLSGTWKAGEHKIFKPIEYASKGASATLSPFARAFDTFGDVARVQIWKTLRYLAKDDKELADLADIVNHMTGMFNSAKLGVSTTQQQLESFLLFSPRYFRAGLALTKDTFQGGFRRSVMIGHQEHPGLTGWRPGVMTTFVAQAPMYYYISASALGQEAKLDPRPKSVGGDGSDFMTYEVGGTRVGFGSWWVSFARLLGSLFADTIQNPDGYATMEVPKDVGYDVYRFLRGKLGPGAATMEDIRSGKTFIGERIEGSNFANYVATAAKIEGARAMPFLLQDMLEGPPDTATIDRLKRAPFSAAGMRVFAESTFTRRDVEEARIVTAEYGEGVAPDDVRAGKLDLPIEQQGLYALKQLYQYDSEWQHLTKLIEDDRLRRGSDEEILLQDFFAETERIEGEYNTTQNKQVAEFRRTGEGKDFIRALARAGVTVSARFDTLRQAPRFKEMLANLDERKLKDLEKRTKEGKIFAGDIAYELYKTDILGKDDIPVESGGFQLPNLELDWEKREAAMSAIAQTAAKLDPRYTADEFAHYVDLRRKFRMPDQVQLDPILADLERARGILEPYWEIAKTKFGSESDWPAIKEFLAADDLQAEQKWRAIVDKGHVRRFVKGKWEGRSDAIKRYVLGAKEFWRKRNPEADALLADYYGGTPLTPRALKMYMERRKARAAGA